VNAPRSSSGEPTLPARATDTPDRTRIAAQVEGATTFDIWTYHIAQETLTRLSLEAERVQVVELARNEMARIPALFDEFAEKLADMGANPLKGF